MVELVSPGVHIVKLWPHLSPKEVSHVMAARLVVTKIAPAEPRRFSLKLKQNGSSLLYLMNYI